MFTVTNLNNNQKLVIMNYTLPFQKNTNPATPKQIKWLMSYDNVQSSESLSQMMKRLPMSDFDDLIEAAKSGETVLID